MTLNSSVKAFAQLTSSSQSLISDIRKQKEELMQAVVEKNEVEVGGQLEKLRGIDRFRQSVRTVILTKRLTGNFDAQWHHRTKRRNQIQKQNIIFLSDSSIPLVMRLLVTAASTMDISILLLEAIGFQSCRSLCQDSGGPFQATAEGMIGYLGPEFWYVRIVMGFMTDLVYITHMVLRSRTIKKGDQFFFAGRQEGDDLIPAEVVCALCTLGTRLLFEISIPV
jgi:hypothetical protein